MKIPPYNPTFGIYKGTKTTDYGYHDFGVYKGLNIDIYHEPRTKTKLQYVSDKFRNFIKSKLVYFEHGIKKITRSKAK